MTDRELLTTFPMYTVIRDENGEQVTPTDIVLRLEDPTHTITMPEVLAVEQQDLAAAAAALGQELSGVTGVYEVVITPDIAGTWHYHWQSTTPTVALYDWFQVPWPTVGAETS